MKKMILDSPTWFQGCVGKRIVILRDNSGYGREGLTGIVTDELWHITKDDGGKDWPIQHGSLIGFPDEQEEKSFFKKLFGKLFK
jgi:hypothetical protein